MGWEPWDLDHLYDWRRQQPEVLADLDLIMAQVLPGAEQAHANSRDFAWSATLPLEPVAEVEVSAWTAHGDIRGVQDVWQRLRERRTGLRAAALVGGPFQPQGPPAVSCIWLDFEHNAGVALELLFPRRLIDDNPHDLDAFERLPDPVVLAGRRRIWTDP